jgi:23S rRNA (guanosine2251-2'-O)-methyltransferase
MAPQPLTTKPRRGPPGKVGPVAEALYGTNAVREALRAGRRSFRRLLVAADARPDRALEEITRLAQERRCPTETRHREQLGRVCRSREHQDVVLEVSPYPYATLEELRRAAREAGPAALLLVLDRVQDPQNVGTLLRTAEAVGVQGVILPEREAVAITPAVVRASAGASEFLRIARVGNLVPAMAELQEAGLWILGLEEEPSANLYTAVDWNRPLAVVVGSEGFGLRRLVRERCDELVRLPMRGRIGSLNAAVAGSVVLYEAWRCRGSNY